MNGHKVDNKTPISKAFGGAARFPAPPHEREHAIVWRDDHLTESMTERDQTPLCATLAKPNARKPDGEMMDGSRPRPPLCGRWGRNRRLSCLTGERVLRTRPRQSFIISAILSAGIRPRQN